MSFPILCSAVWHWQNDPQEINPKDLVAQTQQSRLHASLSCGSVDLFIIPSDAGVSPRLCHNNVIRFLSIESPVRKHPPAQVGDSRGENATRLVFQRLNLRIVSGGSNDKKA